VGGIDETKLSFVYQRWKSGTCDTKRKAKQKNK